MKIILRDQMARKICTQKYRDTWVDAFKENCTLGRGGASIREARNWIGYGSFIGLIVAKRLNYATTMVYMSRLNYATTMVYMSSP